MLIVLWAFKKKQPADPMFIYAYCWLVCVNAVGGWGLPSGKTGKPTSAVGSQFSVQLQV